MNINGCAYFVDEYIHLHLGFVAHLIKLRALYKVNNYPKCSFGSDFLFSK